MEGVVSLLVILALCVIGGAAFGWVAFFQNLRQQRQIEALERQLAALSTQRTENTDSKLSQPAQYEQPVISVSRPPATPPTQVQAPQPKPADPVPVTSWPTSTAKESPTWMRQLQANWMIWLGGLCVSLAGIFMVKYSMDAGLLGPRGRIVLALLSGVTLHIVAEWLRRRQGASDPVFASLAGGASITLYGALLAALNLYHLIDPRLAFGLLAVVSLATMVMALLHGPLLAMIGLVGAYVVPALVSDGSGNITVAMVYSLIISAAALYLLRYVYRPWLWWGVIAGALGWWLISMTTHRGDNFQGAYLACLAWGLVAIPNFDWSLLRGHQTAPASEERLLLPGNLRPTLLAISLFLVTLAWGGAIHHQGLQSGAVAQWLPLLVVLGFAARQRDAIQWLPWLSLAVQCLAWLLLALKFEPGSGHWSLLTLSEIAGKHFIILATVMAAAYVALALLHIRHRGFSHLWLSLALLSPILWLALCYLLVNGISQSLQWGLVSLLLGGLYGLRGALRLEKNQTDPVALWFILGSHAAYSIAVSIYFREAGLTLALAAQLLSLTWALRRYDLPWLTLLIKLLVGVVVTRLTLNPWLLAYPTDIHWSLWTYGGATLFAGLASWQCRNQLEIRRWLEAATLHLLVMTIGTELRYWLYDGAIFTHRYSLTEGAINTTLWAGMALTYYRRSLASESLKQLYQLCSRVLLLLSLASYLSVAVTNNPLWSNQNLSTTPIFNILLLAYGAPAAMALLVAFWHDKDLRRNALTCAGLMLFLFVNLEIRHLWQQSSDIGLHRSTSDGELYTYSIVWLLMAIAGIFGGGRWCWRTLYRAGMGLLALVIGKLFLIDMAGLEGLLRVASFMGLGLSLLGLAWLNHRFQGFVSASNETDSATNITDS